MNVGSGREVAILDMKTTSRCGIRVLSSLHVPFPSTFSTMSISYGYNQTCIFKMSNLGNSYYCVTGVTMVLLGELL